MSHNFRGSSPRIPWNVILTILVVAAYSADARTASQPARITESSARPEIETRFIRANQFILPVSNYGQHGLNTSEHRAGGEWPASSGDMYLFGGGVWVGGTVNQPPFTTVAGVDTIYSFAPSITNPLGWEGTGELETGEPGSRAILTDPRVAMGYEPSGGWDEMSPLTPLYLSGDPDWPLGTPQSVIETYARFDDQDPTRWNTGSQSNSGKGVEWTDPTESIIAVYGLGVEVSRHTQAWNWGQADAVHFMTYTVTNIRTDEKDINNCFIGIVSDPDIGDDSRDDLSGVDPARSVAYAYDSDFDEEEFAGLPGFIAYQLLKGPVAEYDIDRNGDGVVDDAVVDVAGTPIRDVHAGQAMGLHACKSFGRLAGDPSTEWEHYMVLAGHHFREDSAQTYAPFKKVDTEPEDQRFLMSMGPFTLRPGQPVEFVVAVMVAPATGNAEDPVETLASGLFDLADFVQKAYDDGLRMPTPPATPAITVESLTGACRINWNNIAETTPDPFYTVASNSGSEYYDPLYREFDFAGYRVWRRLQSMDDWEMLVDYRSSVTHTHLDTPLVTGRVYEYYVSAYDSQATEPARLESMEGCNLTEVRLVDAPEWVSASELQIATHDAGESDGSVTWKVVDWKAVNGHGYTVEFTSDSTWFMRNTNLSPGEDTVLANQIVLAADDHDNVAPIVDGLLVRVVGPENMSLLKSHSYTPAVNEWFTERYGWYYVVEPPAQDLVKVELRFSQVNESIAPTYDYANGYHSAGVFPGEAWDVTSDPPRRLTVLFTERSEETTHDQQWHPTTSYSYSRELLMVLNMPYDADTTSATWDAFRTMYNPSLSNPYAIYTLRLQTMSEGISFTEGDVLTLEPYKPNNPGDVFSFTTADLPVSVSESTYPTQMTISNAPNPSNPSTTIRFALPETRLVQLTIYNLQGQRVRTLVNQSTYAGYHQVTWDGRDRSGRAVASGVYLIRLVTPGKALTRRVTLVR
jgi:hypothetical protein